MKKLKDAIQKADLGEADNKDAKQARWITFVKAKKLSDSINKKSREIEKAAKSMAADTKTALTVYVNSGNADTSALSAALTTITTAGKDIGRMVNQLEELLL